MVPTLAVLSLFCEVFSVWIMFAQAKVGVTQKTNFPNKVIYLGCFFAQDKKNNNMNLVHQGSQKQRNFIVL